MLPKIFYRFALGVGCKSVIGQCPNILRGYLTPLLVRIISILRKRNYGGFERSGERAKEMIGM